MSAQVDAVARELYAVAHEEDGFAKFATFIRKGVEDDGFHRLNDTDKAALRAIKSALSKVAELIAAVQDERILRDLGADVDSKTLASAMRRTSAALRNCRASTLAAVGGSK